MCWFLPYLLFVCLNYLVRTLILFFLLLLVYEFALDGGVYMSEGSHKARVDIGSPMANITESPDVPVNGPVKQQEQFMFLNVVFSPPPYSLNKT